MHTECLFVGGPCDGRRRPINSQESIVDVPAIDMSTRLIDNLAPDEGVLDIVRYRREKLFAPGRQWDLFVAPEVEPGEVIARLIDGYTPRK